MGISRGSSRRNFLVNSAAAAAALYELRRTAWASGLPTGSPACTLIVEQEVGPYYVSDELLRADIREGKPGLPLILRLSVLDVRTCKPLPEAAIDLWHCDAMGIYSGFTKINPPPPPGDFGAPGGPPGPPTGQPPGQAPEFDAQHPGRPKGPPGRMGMMKPMDELTFLRGIQFTNEEGVAVFETVFPGFYSGRTNHIHFKVRDGGRVVARNNASHRDRTYKEGHTAHTGQVFFPEDLAAELMTHEPYSKHQIHRTTQAEDRVFRGQDGAASVAKLRLADVHRTAAGFIADLIVAVDPTATPAPVQMRGPGGPPSI